MNKLFKKIAACFTAFVMMFFAVGSVNVFADNEPVTPSIPDSYTIKTNDDHSYDVYQVMTGTPSIGEDNKVIFTDLKWGSSTSDSGKAVSKEVIDTLNSKKNDSEVAELVAGYAAGAKVGTVTKDSSLSNLAPGYYLVKDTTTIDSTDVTADSKNLHVVKLTGTEAEITITKKRDVPEVTKKIKDKGENNTDWQDTGDYNIGDEIEYKIEGTIPSEIYYYSSYTYIFTDTMSDGLDYKAGSIAIKANDENGADLSSYFDVAYTNHVLTVTAKTDGNNKGLISIPGVVTTNTDGIKSQGTVTSIVVTYKATLNTDAVLGNNTTTVNDTTVKGNANAVNLTFSNNPNKGGEGETDKTPDDIVTAFTFKLVVNKVGEDAKTPLKGAAFTLYKSDGTTEVGTSTAGEDTQFNFSGLDAGTYVLKETTTPDGYQTMADMTIVVEAEHTNQGVGTALEVSSLVVKVNDETVSSTDDSSQFVIDTNKSSMTTTVVNSTKGTLPETGGMGTTMLYIAGGVLVLGSVVFFMTSRKMKKD